MVAPASSVQATAAPEPSPPTSSPAIAPASVSPRHQMPSTSSGQNVDAATAKASPTARATPTSGAASAASSGTTTATDGREPERGDAAEPAPPTSR